MLFGTYEATILDDLPDVTDRGLLRRTANRVIQSINSKITGIATTEDAVTVRANVDEQDLTIDASTSPDSITGSGFGDIQAGDIVWIPESDKNTEGYEVQTVTDTKIEVATEDVLTSETVTSNLIAFTLGTGYSYDLTTNRVTLPKKLKELLKVFHNDDDCRSRTVEYLRANPGEDAFAETGRSEIELAADLLASTGDTLVINMYRLLEELTATKPDTEIDVPLVFEEMLITGSLYYLTSKPRFRDEVLYEDNKQKFLTELRSVEDTEIGRMPIPQAELEYRY